MSTKNQAEDYVRRYFNEVCNIELLPVKRPEKGFDFRNADSTLFVEVKGTTATNLSKAMFRYFTNAEYEAAKRSALDGTSYEIHLIIGIGSLEPQHFIIPGQKLVETGKPETWWALSLTKDFLQFRMRLPLKNAQL
jgi:hypothetical protein